MNICQKVEEAAFSAYSEVSWTDIPADKIYQGIENDTRADDTDAEQEITKVPCIIFECSKATPSVQFTGNWTGHLRVWVESSSFDDTRQAHQDRVDEVFRYILASNMRDLLSALEGFTAFQCRVSGQGYEIKGNRWASYMDFDVECCGSDL